MRSIMSSIRIALANLSYPASPDQSVAKAVEAITEAGRREAAVICFPECYVPGYRRPGQPTPPPDTAFLERAWAAVAEAAARAKITVVLGTERLEGDALYATVLIIRPDGIRDGFQDKVQVAPAEDGLYTPGSSRRVFTAGPLTFGIAICHEGWRYPESVRWAARHGAQLVFHPHLEEAELGSYVPTSFGEQGNSFHEKAMLCRAAENTCFFASVNYASESSPTTSAIARPDGTLLAWQPYGEEGLLIADIELDEATGLLARRYRPI
jgi:predicted amidohydrolase